MKGYFTLNDIKTMVLESVKKCVNEIYDLNDELPPDGLDGEVEDDWRLEEPSADAVGNILSQVEQKCAEDGAVYKDLGDNEFGVIVRNGGGMNIGSFLSNLEQKGVIYNTGGGISQNGPWHAKYRVIHQM